MLDVKTCVVDTAPPRSTAIMLITMAIMINLQFDVLVLNSIFDQRYLECHAYSRHITTIDLSISPFNKTLDLRLQLSITIEAGCQGSVLWECDNNVLNHLIRYFSSINFVTLQSFSNII
jgi:hypothetical protein